MCSTTHVLLIHHFAVIEAKRSMLPAGEGLPISRFARINTLRIAKAFWNHQRLKWFSLNNKRIALLSPKAILINSLASANIFYSGIKTFHVSAVVKQTEACPDRAALASAEGLMPQCRAMIAASDAYSLLIE